MALVVLTVLVLLIELRAIEYAYERIGVSSRYLSLTLFDAVLGSYVNIPLRRVDGREMSRRRSNLARSRHVTSRATTSAATQVLDMNVCSNPRVISEVPSVVVRVLIDDDLIRIPEPAINKRIVVGRHAEVEAIEPETLSVPSGQAEDVAWPETARESPMLPRVIEVIVRIEPT